MPLRPYEMPWRPALEGYSALAWLLALGVFVYLASGSHLPATLAWPPALTCLAMASVSNSIQ